MINKVFQRTLHRELWQWLSENPKCDKEDWVRWDFNGGNVKRVNAWCFACGYVCRDGDSCNAGKQCPIQWKLGSCIEGDKSEYEQWINTRKPQERTRLALIIKDLPVRDGIDWE